MLECNTSSERLYFLKKKARKAQQHRPPKEDTKRNERGIQRAKRIMGVHATERENEIMC